MKRLENNKKTKITSIMLSALCMSQAGLMGDMVADVTMSQAAWADASPFADGTTKVRLTDEEKASLLQYADNSKARLEKAQQEANGKSFAEANAIYLKAIKAVVVASFKDKPRSELLMRYALNQGLELTFGVPTADGKGFEKPGVLAGISNKDLLTVILEDSIKLALAYYQDDRTAIEKGTLTDLPYMKQAIERLGMTRTWLISVTEPVSMYALSVAAFQHFLNTAANEDQQHRALYAEELTSVDELLRDNPKTPTTDTRELMRSVRVLRGELRRLQESAAKKLEQTSGNVVTAHPLMTPPYSVANDLGMQFVSIGPGTFVIGSPNNEAGRDGDENQHKVILTRAFGMQTTNVTQTQWAQVMGTNPSEFQGAKYCTIATIRTASGNDVDVCPKHPVEEVSWEDLQIFISKLNKSQNLDCGDTATVEGFEKARNTRGCYRLPTEAEWEFAARGGTSTAYSFGNDPSELGEYAWFEGNSGNHTHEVMTRKSNPFGLYDMHGNVWQWVQDGYDRNYGLSNSTSVTDPIVTSSGSGRVIRGGSWNNYAGNLRSANRDSYVRAYRYSGLGFRLVRT